jgi:hypothetical protein
VRKLRRHVHVEQGLPSKERPHSERSIGQLLHYFRSKFLSADQDSNSQSSPQCGCPMSLALGDMGAMPATLGAPIRAHSGHGATVLVAKPRKPQSSTAPFSTSYVPSGRATAVRAADP